VHLIKEADRTLSHLPIELQSNIKNMFNLTNNGHYQDGRYNVGVT